MDLREFPDLPAGAQVNQDEWDLFAERFGRAHWRGLVHGLSRMPSGPRCEACGGPFGGLGGRVMRSIGRGPSRKNPRWCAACFEEAPEGGFTATIGVLFIDVRGSTALGETLTPRELVRRLNEFYDLVTRVVVRHGLVDKLIGDEVMGIYLPPFSPGGRFIDTLVGDARELVRSIGYGSSTGPVIDVGIGIDVGPAYVGPVGEGEVKDFTAIGDVVNTASRLQAVAERGQIVMPERVARDAGLDSTLGQRVELELKGKARPLDARVLAAA